MSRQIIWLAGLTLSVLTAAATAEPYLAIRAGMDCGGCHTNPTGGGQRNAFGYVYAQTVLAREAATGAASVWNGQLGEHLRLGGNFRVAASQTDVDDADTNLEFATERATVFLSAELTPELTVYADQQVAPGGSLNREAWVQYRRERFSLKAGRLFLPFGWRLEDDTAFVRQVSGVNMLQGDDGVELGWADAGWSAQLAVTNGNGGGGERDDGKQFTARIVRHAQSYSVGASVLDNTTDNIDRRGYALFAGLNTGPVAWLVEYDRIEDDGAAFEAEQDIVHLEANWLAAPGHNVKFTVERIDDDATGEVDDRYGVVYELSPFPFAQLRLGVRTRDSDNPLGFRNSDEGFIELHGFF